MSAQGHFSIVVSPAPHLNGGYTVFGEVVEGMEAVNAINKLTKPGSDRALGTAIVSQAGCLLNCEPRPEVGAKCSQRETALTSVQGRKVHMCVD